MSTTRPLLSDIDEGSDFYYAGAYDVFRCTLKKKEGANGSIVIFHSENGTTYDSQLHPRQEIFLKREDAITDLMNDLKRRKKYIHAMIDEREAELIHIEKQIEKYEEQLHQD